MAIDKDIKIIQTTTPAVSTTTAEVKSSGSTAIPINENKKKSDPITEAIKNPEFLKLTKEEQLKKLKELFPNVNEKELSGALNTVKSTIESETADTTADDTAVAAGKTKEEALVEQYAATLGKNISIDDVIAHIKSKKPEELTADEKKVLEAIKLFESGNKKEIIDKYADELDNLIPKDKVQTPEWQKKSPVEKLDARVDAVLAKTITNFDKLPEEQKAQYRNSLYNKLGSAADPKWDTYSEKEKTVKKELMAVLVDAKEHVNVSIKELLNKTPEEREKIVIEYASDKLFSNFVNDESIDVTSDDWQGKPSNEKVDMIVESAIRSVDPNFDKLSDKEKAEKKKAYIDIIGKKMYGEEEWAKNEDKTLAMGKFAHTFSAIKNSGKSLKEVMSSPKEYVEVMRKYNNEIGYKNAGDEIVYETILHCNKIKLENQDIYNYLSEKKEKSGLTPEENQRYKILASAFKISDKSRTAKCKDKHQYIEQEIEQHYNGDVKEYIKARYKNIDELRKNEKLLKQIVGDCKEVETAEEICKLVGVEPAYYIQADQISEDLAENIIAKNTDGINKGNTLAHKSGNDRMVRNVISIVPQEITDAAQITKVDAHVLKLDSKYSIDVAKSLNSDYVTTENAKIIASNLDTDKEISNSAKALFTQDFITTAKNDDIRLDYAKTLSEIDNPAVLEGISAATNSVEDSSIKAQYTSVTDTAAKKYPPEQQAAIRTARETGEISQTTLSQTTPEVVSAKNDGTTNNTNNNAARNTAENNVEKISVQNSNNGYTESPKTGTPTSSEPVISAAAQRQTAINTGSIRENQSVTAPSDSPAAAAATAASEKKPAAAASTSQTTEALEAKRDAVGEKILDYQEKVKADTNAREAAETITEEDLAEIETILNSENIEISEKEEIRQVLNKQSNISAIYNIIINKFGTQAQDKFLEILAVNGSSSNIRSFVNSMKSDTSVIKKLYAHCSNQKLKTELLGLLPADDIMAMISAGQINNLNDIDHKILYEFLSKNMSSMSNTAFSSYLQYLSIDERERLVELRNSAKGIENTPSNTISRTEQISQNGADAVDNTSAAVNNNNGLTQTRPVFADNELTKTLNDGTVVKRKETFGAISDTAFDEGYEELDRQVSDTPAMEDGVYTPGSSEWYRNHNRQAVTVATEPTFENEEYAGLPLGSNKFNNKRPLKRINIKGSFTYKA